MRGLRDAHPQHQGGPTTAVADLGAPVSPVLVAAVLLAAGEHLRALDLPRPDGRNR